MYSIKQALADGFASMFGTPDNSLDFCDVSALAALAARDTETEDQDDDSPMRQWERSRGYDAVFDQPRRRA